MTRFEAVDGTGAGSSVNSWSTSTLNAILSAQFVVAWAGERGEDARLGWWRTDLASEFGGEDLFRRLMPRSWPWAVLEGAREAARRHDAECRARAADPDQLTTLFRLGFALDERVDDHLRSLKRQERAPYEVLPDLAICQAEWSRADFEAWVDGHGAVDVVTDPAGRRVKADATLSPDLLVKRLVAALRPCGPNYPMPHVRRSP